jgi:predicted RNase H-like HicB family nuclease
VKYAVVFERSPNNYSAYVPDLPGCVATGKTRDEVSRRIHDAVQMHIEGLRSQQQPIPQPRSWTDLIEA